MKIFETERLSATHITTKHIDHLLRIYNSDENMRFVSNGKSCWTKRELIDKYDKVNKHYDSGYGIFTIQIKDTNEIIGEAGLFNSFNNLKKLELGYIIDHKFWQLGFGKETCFGLIKYAFNCLNAKTLIARMYAENTNSIKLVEKCGMVKTDSGLTEYGKEFFTYKIETNKDRL
ncbi:MAG: GNAT family N-acetyltransferase [Carboxylicivirga sp.]|jgi:RimJ/RimL family protein N-acetyltransferase|nr:GNAT family N-acetyltransferase [Carboxylicivirga sp.]